jgi:putative hydrolase of the HAD superfamily
MNDDLLMDEKKIWLIDLDNTLYEQSGGLMEIMDKRIESYFVNKLRCNLKEASILRNKLYAKYQNTFVGAKNEKIILQEELYEFMKFVHNFNFENIIVPNSELIAVLNEVKGNKYVFSNSIRLHIDNVLRVLNVAHLFDGVYDIISFSYKYKPDSYPFRLFKEQNNVAYSDIVFIDDSEVNLDAARNLGSCVFHPNVVKDFCSTSSKFSHLNSYTR